MAQAWLTSILTEPDDFYVFSGHKLYGPTESACL